MGHRLTLRKKLPTSIAIMALGCALAGLACAAPASALQGHAEAQADMTLVRQVLAQLAAHPVVRGDFVQTRTSAVLGAPSVSRGTFVFARDKGVIWQVRQPDLQGFVYGKSRSARLDAQGGIASVDSQPAAVTRQVAQWSAALASGDISSLASQFSVTASGTLQSWRLVLVPTQPQIAQAMRQLTMRGDDHVREVTLETRRGDTVTWRFDIARDGAATLTQQEQRVLQAVE